jgi:hypothetical protein
MGTEVPDALQFLVLEHRRLMDLLGDLKCRQSQTSAAPTDARITQVCAEILAHFALKDRVVFPAIRRISCASAWGILEDTLGHHREIGGRVDAPLSPSLRPTERFECLSALYRRLALTFSDEENRLLDEARRHLSSGELSDLAKRMIAERGSAQSESA